MGPVMIALHLAMVAVLCAGLSGISVGLGARLPNLRETDPSKIAVGFGGTLNLLVSLVYIFAIVTAMAIPCHLYFLSVEYPGATSLALSHGGLRVGALGGGDGQPDHRRAGDDHSPTNRNQGVRAHGILSDDAIQAISRRFGRAEGKIAESLGLDPAGVHEVRGRVSHRRRSARARCTISFTRCLVTL